MTEESSSVSEVARAARHAFITTATIMLREVGHLGHDAQPEDPLFDMGAAWMSVGELFQELSQAETELTLEKLTELVEERFKLRLEFPVDTNLPSLILKDCWRFAALAGFQVAVEGADTRDVLSAIPELLKEQKQTYSLPQAQE